MEVAAYKQMLPSRGVSDVQKQHSRQQLERRGQTLEERHRRFGQQDRQPSS